MEDDKLLVERLKAQSEQLKYEHEMLRHAEVIQVIEHEMQNFCHFEQHIIVNNE